MFYQQPEFPALWFGIVCLCLSLLLIWVFYTDRFFIDPQQAFQARLFRVFNMMLGLIIGISWVFWQTFFMPVIPERVLNQPVFITGKLIELPNQELTKHRVKIQYVIKVDSISSSLLAATNEEVSYAYQFKPIVSINWYLSTKELSFKKPLPKLGETWQMRVKLKANHAAMNPGAFDYEAWLFQKGVTAKGYIKSLTKSEAHLQDTSVVLKIADTPWVSLSAWRSWLAQRLQQVFSDSEFISFYKALTFGDKSSISADDWVLLQNTGTIHLMVISGLHMGIIAFLGFWFFKQVWRWVGYRQTMVDLPKFAALGGLLFATLYLTISGFSIPTQRAWLMVAAVLGFILVRRTFQPWSALSMAALLVVLVDTTAVLSFGFWLSFLAVSFIFLALQRHQGGEKNATGEKRPFYGRWLATVKTFLWIQWVLTLGLAPFLIWAFHSLPVYSFIANLIAVPFVSVLGLPWLFLSSVVGVFSVSLGQWMIAGLDLFWQPFWQFLQWVHQLPLNTVAFSDRPVVWLLSIYALLFLGFWLKNRRHQYFLQGVVFLWIMSLSFGLLNSAERPKENQLVLTVLDVGQAQAIVMETKNHIILYDLGGKWGKNMDGTKLAIQPYLTSRGWKSVDILIVSHSDQDHSGGLKRLLNINNMPVKKALSGQPEVLNRRIQQEGFFQLCESGQSWTLDGIVFEILSPNKGWMEAELTSDNDRSCVLKITIGDQKGGKKILITGDLSQKGEALLLKTYEREALQANLLVAGHHGSQSSTSMAWLEAVSPTYMVFSAGYLNRFNFPSQAVLQRIIYFNKQREPASSIQWWNTACSGALRFEVSPERINLPQEYRKIRRKWYHHRCLDSQQGHLFQ